MSKKSYEAAESIEDALLRMARVNSNIFDLILEELEIYESNCGRSQKSSFENPSGFRYAADDGSDQGNSV